MTNPLKKLEDALEEISTSLLGPEEKTDDFDFEPEPYVPPSPKRLSLSRILDFSFPGEITEPEFVQIGEVSYVGDGVCHVVGLDKATVEEIIEIHTRSGVQKALILGIQEEKVEAVVLGDYSKIKRGDEARSTSARLRAPVGPALLGRVINPLGEALDGKGPVKPESFRDVEFMAPSVMDRAPIDEPMHTGVMVIDSTIPIGRGQRELVIGDRKTGKSRTMIDIICNQKGHDVPCIYVGVGIQAAKAKATLKLLEERGAMKYTAMVISLADEPPSLQYIAPYVGCALGEYYMYSGKNALIVYDDLSKQAKAYRQVSLLLKRSPGRDAYPGDIFFLHSRLLERASRLSPKLKGGSLTAMPIAETQSGDISDYIITNLMSITDGHIFLDANLMHEGVLPAVNSGASVSRIGGKVQTPLLRKVGELAGRILARYNEVKSFETINTEVSEDTIRDIKRGKRMKEILAQDSTMNLSADEQVVILGIASSSRMDHLELSHTVIIKKNIIPYYRELKLDDFIAKANKAKSMDEIDPILDRIFHDFCIKFKLPTLSPTLNVPKAA